MDNVEDKFKAKTRALGGVFQYGDAQTGFKIPTYQRPYSWDKKHISRLIEDIVENINNLAHDKHHNEREIYTFLGAMIITKEEKLEDNFNGNSYLIIDGQQRLTTLSLLACMLIEWLNKNETELLSEAKKELKPAQIQIIEKLLDNSSDLRLILLQFCLGIIYRHEGTTYFPKIIHDNKKDHRSKNKKENVCKSSIAELLYSFGEYFDNNKSSNSNENFNYTPSDPQGKIIKNNLENLRDVIEKLSKNEYTGEEYYASEVGNPDEGDYSFRIFTNDKEGFLDSNIITILELNEKKYKDLITKIYTDDENSFCNKSLFPFLRTYLFGKYLVNNVIMSIVECPNEHYAFSIFEKINTTGEPLTALETFRSDITHLSNSEKNQKIKEVFSEVETYINDYAGYGSNNEESLVKRRTASAEVVLAFNQYYHKARGSKQLNIQRSIMKTFSKKNKDEQLEFVNVLNNVCIYRKKFWDGNTIRSDDLNDPAARVCLLYLKSMKKTLTIPLLARLFANNNHDSESMNFINHVKSLAAFTILWRAYTGGTDGIERQYRSLFKVGDLEFSKNLQQSLLNKIGGDKSRLRENWINKVLENNLYDQGNKNTAKFIILCVEDKKYYSENFKDSHRKDYLDDVFWNSELYETIEHIAPRNPKKGDSSGIKISNHNLQNTIGNLILLPKGANSAADNIPWSKKKDLYKALSESKKEKAQECAANLGGKLTKAINENAEISILPIIKELSKKKKWEVVDVEKRGKEILSYAWDELYEWI